MSTRALKFLVEDALVSYLTGTDAPNCRVYKTLSAAISGVAQEPCIMVAAPDSRPEEPDAPIDNDVCANRRVNVNIRVRTHAEPTMDSSGAVEVETAREAHVNLCGLVLEKMQQSDLIAQLNAQGVAGVYFLNWTEDQGDSTAPAESSLVSEFRYAFAVAPVAA
jgi:hypothetical protein